MKTFIREMKLVFSLSFQYLLKQKIQLTEFKLFNINDTLGACWSSTDSLLLNWELNVETKKN